MLSQSHIRFIAARGTLLHAVPPSTRRFSSSCWLKAACLLPESAPKKPLQRATLSRGDGLLLRGLLLPHLPFGELDDLLRHEGWILERRRVLR